MRLRSILPRRASLLCVLMLGFFTEAASALPADFIGEYEILDTRRLSLASGAAHVIQDGQLILEIQRNRMRPYCRTLQSIFDESFGAMEVRFTKKADGSELAIIKTIPESSGARPTTIECYSESGFFGALDLSIALGQIVQLSR